MTDQEAHDLYNEFLAHASTDRLQKILARYEQLRMIEGVPGDIVECGVFKGAGFYTLAKLNHIMMPHAGRKIIGFDLFGAPGNKKLKKKTDRDVLEWHENKTVGMGEIQSNLAKNGIHNTELIAGDVVQTTKVYAKDNPGFRIAMLYLDVDNYEGTLAILRNFFPLVAPGGVVVFDEYGQREHGESDAVDEYFKGSKYKLRMPPRAASLSAYVIKEGF